jgi:hypothetical protein
MFKTINTKASLQWLRVLAIAASLLAGSATTSAQAADGAAALRERYATLKEQLGNNEFKRPIYLDSIESGNDLKGNIYAVIDHPFAMVSSSLSKVERWCDVLILPINVKHCRASGAGPSASKISISIGKKLDQTADNAYRIDLDYRVAAQSADYLQIVLTADSGPVGTRDYRLMFASVPIDSRRSFIHLSYQYGYGTAARLAMKAYLVTAGSGKVGFSVVDRSTDGQPVYVSNMRGVMERNTMRYYLAIDSYLGALSAPAHEQLERRLHSWFTATERYPRQLRELELAEYLDMKRREVRRMAEAPSPRPG